MKELKNIYSGAILLSDPKRPDKTARKTVLSILLAITILTALPSGQLINGVARADQKGPSFGNQNNLISGDLLTLTNNTPSATVPVIIETNAALNRQAFSKLLTKISRIGGMVSRRLSNDKYVAVRLPAALIPGLASDEAVSYMSLDKTTQVSG